MYRELLVGAELQLEWSSRRSPTEAIRSSGGKADVPESLLNCS
jgi:hypothetical protein